MFSQASVSHSAYNGPHGYSITAHPCYRTVGTHPTGMLPCLHIFVLETKIKMCKICTAFQLFFASIVHYYFVICFGLKTKMLKKTRCGICALFIFWLNKIRKRYRTVLRYTPKNFILFTHFVCT